MYDEIKCEVKLPDTDQGEGVIFQTKSFPDACLQRYVITKAGRLIDPRKNDLEPDGSIIFYTTKIHSDNGGSLKDRWREYRAHFSKGQLVNITRVGADEDPGIRHGLASYRWFDTPSFNFSNLNNAEEQDTRPQSSPRKIRIGVKPQALSKRQSLHESLDLTNVRQVEAYAIGTEMKRAGLPDGFIVAAVTGAHEFEGIFDLLKMWRIESESAGRDAIIATIQELIEDIKAAGSAMAGDRADPVATSRGNLDEVSAMGDSIIDALSFSDHGFPQIVTLAVHAVAARKILNDPSLIEQARTTLERWISRQRPAPEPLMEWRQILTGTPDQVASVAMSLTEEATRLRSCSPLGFVLTHEERAAVYAAFGDKLKSIADYREEWRARE